jgi:hypothetical protein
MLAFMSVGLPLVGMAVLSVLYCGFEWLLDHVPGLEAAIFKEAGALAKH